MNTQPTVIRKHWFGLLVILLIGGAVMGLIAGLMTIFYYQSALTLTLYVVLSVVLVTVLAATVVTGYVYRLSFMAITDSQLEFTNWYTLFYDSQSVCEWRNIEDVNVKRGGIFAQILGFGTLLVQTAGTQNNLTMTMVPKVEALRNELASRADAATAKVPYPVEPY
ncbi:membrane protein YdbS with pleckstrin-like domain [Arthrobacter sp. UYCu511]|uniref:hypothetical protein n=1 Tax=Arthrobacter sp. UYCu511 TaxID=3156337 RepID=UPI003396856F